jgi:ATP synthase protein I
VDQDDLAARIEKARAASGRRDPSGAAPAADADSKRSMGLGLRVGSQFVSSLAVGGLLGWGVDRWLGTAPFGLLILLLLGFVAGLIGLRKVMTGP